MSQASVLLLLLHVLTPCTAFYASPLIQIDAGSFDTADAMKQAAQILNVPVPANWASYMSQPSTTGSSGKAQIGSTTVNSAMASWSIPNEFRAQATQNVKLLVLAATEGSFTGQAFIFDIPSGAFLSTLLIVVKKLDSPIDPNQPVAIAYVAINSNTVIKQQYTPYTVRKCSRCAKCVWTRHCCCHDETMYSPRGNTLQEVQFIKQKMTADQLAWFSQQPLLNIMIKNFVLSQNNNNNHNLSLTEIIEKYLSNNKVKAEILASYNDSVLSTLQSHMGSLKLSSQTLKMTKITIQNIPIILSALASDYGFEDISNDPEFVQQLQTGEFSYENLFTTYIDKYNKNINIKYIWLLGQTMDNLTYSINFFFLNITSQTLIDTLLFNVTNIDEPIKIVRISTLNDDGEFFNEHLSTMNLPWQLRTTRIVLNILRFTTASALIPQKHRLLSYFNPEIILPELNPNNTSVSGLQEDLLPKINALAEAITAVSKSWKEIVNAFKTTTSTTIQRIVQFGFTYFSQKTTLLKVINMPAEKTPEFVNALISDYNLPAKGSFVLGLTYSNDFAWDAAEYLYSPTSNGIYRSLALFKNGDSLSNTASFLVVDINADWKLAPDLLLIQSSRSVLGGIFEKNKQSIQEVPHALTIDEAIKLQQFFMLIAMSNIASTLRLNVTLPSLQ